MSTIRRDCIWGRSAAHEISREQLFGRVEPGRNPRVAVPTMTAVQAPMHGGRKRKTTTHSISASVRHAPVEALGHAVMGLLAPNNGNNKQLCLAIRTTAR